MMDDEVRTDFAADVSGQTFDDQNEVYGIISDLDALEELVEDLDEFNLTTRDEVDQALARAQERVGDRVADDLASRLENMLAAMRDYAVMSREDVIAKMADFDAEAAAIETGEDSLES
jgi:hypothetical protein